MSTYLSIEFILKVIIVNTIYSHVSLPSIKSLYAEDEQGPRESLTLPQKCISVSTKPLQAITTLNDNLLVGGKNCIEAFSWNQLVLPQNSDQKLKPCWKVDLRLPT